MNIDQYVNNDRFSVIFVFFIRFCFPTRVSFMKQIIFENGQRV